MTEPRTTDRELEALAEMARTRLTRPLALAVVLAFVAALALEPVLYLAGRITSGRAAPSAAFVPPGLQGGTGPLAANRRLRLALAALERRLESDSPGFARLRPVAQWLHLVLLRSGNATVHAGPDGWLLLRSELDLVLGDGLLEPAALARRGQALADGGFPPAADPRPALVRLALDLRARGIALAVLFVPSKLSVHPERFASRPIDRLALPRNRSFDELRAALERAGALVFDPLPVLRAAAESSGEPVYLATDTHWRPSGMRACARALAEFLGRHVDLPEAPPLDATVSIREVSHPGDLALHLKLPAWSNHLPWERVRIEVIAGSGATPLVPGSGASVLLLGDSFTNIYSAPHRGFGSSAGLAEHLALALGRPVERLAHDGSALTGVAELRRELLAGRDRLAGKRVVVLEIGERFLAESAWPPTALPPPAAPLPAATAPARIEAEVAAVAPVPQPGRSPYRECLVAVRLRDAAASSGEAPPELLAYLWGLRDDRPAEAAALRPGQRVRLRLEPWAEAERELGSYMRVELADPEALGLPAYFATLEPGLGDLPPGRP